MRGRRRGKKSWIRHTNHPCGRKEGGGKAVCGTGERGGAEDIQRGPTVVVSDGGSASAHPANAPGARHTHTLRPGLKCVNSPANCILTTSTTHQPTIPPQPPKTQSGIGLQRQHRCQLCPAAALPLDYFSVSETRDDWALDTKTERTSQRSEV